MILGQQPHTPFVPVIAPHGDWEHSNVTPLFGFGITDEEIAARTEQQLIDKRDDAVARDKRNFIIFGLTGVALGSIITGGMMALSFRSFRKTDSIVGPAVYAGAGSAVVGAAMILLLAKVTSGEKVDKRLSALSVGVNASA